MGEDHPHPQRNEQQGKEGRPKTIEISDSMHEGELEVFSRGAKGIGGRQRLSPKKENKGEMDI